MAFFALHNLVRLNHLMVAVRAADFGNVDSISVFE
jgi:hypothetical protein